VVRDFTLGTVDWEILWHVGFLAVMAAAGLTIASRRMAALLLK
jgi:hypothetical protein